MWLYNHSSQLESEVSGSEDHLFRLGQHGALWARRKSGQFYGLEVFGSGWLLGKVENGLVVLFYLLRLWLLPQDLVSGLRLPLHEALRVASSCFVPSLNDLVQSGQVLLFKILAFGLWIGSAFIFVDWFLFGFFSFDLSHDFEEVFFILGAVFALFIEQ